MYYVSGHQACRVEISVSKDQRKRPELRNKVQPEEVVSLSVWISRQFRLHQTCLNKISWKMYRVTLWSILQSDFWMISGWVSSSQCSGKILSLVGALQWQCSLSKMWHLNLQFCMVFSVCYTLYSVKCNVDQLIWHYTSCDVLQIFQKLCPIPSKVRWLHNGLITNICCPLP